MQPTVFEHLRRSLKKIEEYFKCPQEVTFTVEDGALYILEV